MQKNLIKNFSELATTENRKLALTIAEAGLYAIDTDKAVSNSVKLTGNILNVMGENFDLAKFKKIKVVGFGKASSEAALALERILGSKIQEGFVIGLHKADSNYIEICAGTHPRPSQANVVAGEKIYEIIKDSEADDLIIVLVSGGGSALLCYPESECDQSVKLYNEFLKCGQTIAEINTVRKHLSLLKGGGLAKFAYPATVIGLIFSDIPGDNFSDVASGPTYKDESFIADAEKVIHRCNLGKFNLLETPKEDKYFEKVHNFVLVSNKTAVEAMAKAAQEFNLEAKIISTDLYDEIGEVIKKIFSVSEKDSVVLAAGEPSIKIKDKMGKGGRNLHLGLEIIKDRLIEDGSVFISLASDGLDNSDVAGVVIDSEIIKTAEKSGLNAEEYLKKFDSYNFFQKAGGMIKTGPTGANVSDLMILVTKNQKHNE